MIGQGQEFNPYLQTWFTLWPDRWSDAPMRSKIRSKSDLLKRFLWCDPCSDEI